MPASKVDLVIEQGADWEHIFYLFAPGSSTVPLDLTGYTANMQIRSTVSAPTAIVSLSTDNGRVAITPLAGRITLTLRAADAVALTIGYAVYDLVLTSPAGAISRLAQGGVTLSFAVTR